MSNIDNSITVTFRISRKLDTALRERALRHGRTLTSIFIQALEAEMSDEPPAWFTKWQTQEKRGKK